MTKKEPRAVRFDESLRARRILGCVRALGTEHLTFSLAIIDEA